MHPVLIDLGSWKLPSYGAALVLSFALGVGLAYLRAARAGLDREAVLDISIWVMVGAFVGARAFYVLTHVHEFQPPHGRLLDVVDPFREDGRVRLTGFSVMGGVPAAALAAAGYLRWKRLPVLAYMDLLAPSVALGAAVTRLGCFLNGCCFGMPSSLPFAVRYPAGSPAWATFGDVTVHPTPIYQSLAALAIFGSCMAIGRAHTSPGTVFFALLLLMGGQRLIAEHFRFAEQVLRTSVMGDVTVNAYQIAALLLAMAGAIGLYVSSHRGNDAPSVTVRH